MILVFGLLSFGYFLWWIVPIALRWLYGYFFPPPRYVRRPLTGPEPDAQRCASADRRYATFAYQGFDPNLLRNVPMSELNAFYGQALQQNATPEQMKAYQYAGAISAAVAAAAAL